MSVCSFCHEVAQIRTREKIAVIILKFQQGGFTIEDADEMLNSVDHDLTALALHCLSCP